MLGFVISIREAKGSKRNRNAGYELIIADFYMKDGCGYVIPKHNLGLAQEIEVTAISEIRKNAKLVAFEIRYRANGEIKMNRVHGPELQLINAMDKFGYQ